MTVEAAPLYWVEEFGAQERAALSPYFTNLDGPVFALRNLPESVKGALFARYSRTGKSLRRLFLDEFAADLADGPAPAAGRGDGRAEALYERVFNEYGDDSVAQLGAAHVACEQASNVLTKLLEWGRLAAYLEQSTRYVSYAARRDGRFRYHIDPAVDASALGPEYRRVLDDAFETYGAVLPQLRAHFERRLPREPGVSDVAYRRAVRAAAFDALRGLLPAATTSNLGIFASGQAYEALVLRLRASDLPEGRTYAELLLRELRAVIPAFLTRVDRPDRGGEWSRYLAQTAAATAAVTDELFAPPPAGVEGESVRLTDYDPGGEDKVLAAIAYPNVQVAEAAVAERVRTLSATERARLFSAYVGERRNRRHKPGRAFERAFYTFDVVTDYGAFRDLQRHRMCTVVWQPLSPALGYTVPDAVQEAGAGGQFERVMAASARLFEMLHPSFPQQAPYAVALAHRVRFAITLNARELMHLTELRSAPQGHPAYRAVAQRMHRLIAEQAGHDALAGAMRFVVQDAGELGRLAAEERLAAGQRAANASAP